VSVEQTKLDPTGPALFHGVWIAGQHKESLCRDPTADKGPLDEACAVFGKLPQFLLGRATGTTALPRQCFRLSATRPPAQLKLNVWSLSQEGGETVKSLHPSLIWLE
jgi:hypothetical protein